MNEFRNELIKAVNRFCIDHEYEDAIAVMCNLTLDLVEQTDEEFAEEFVGVVMENGRFYFD